MEPIGGPKGKRKGKIKKAESESENEVRPRSKIRKNAEEMDGKQIAGGSQMCKNKDLEIQLGSRPNLRKKMKDPIFKEALERKFYEYTEEYGEYPDSLQMMELVEEEMEDEILMREVSKELNNGKHRKWAEEMIIEEPSDEGKPEEEWESTKKTRKPKEKIVNERVKVQNRFESLSELDSDEEEPKMEEKTVKAKTPPVVVDGQPKNHQQFISETTSQIKEDIGAAWSCEEQRTMLYYCLDEKPLQEEHKITKMEEFLAGSNKLESVHESLKKQVHEIESLTKEISGSVRDIKNKIENVNLTKTL